MSLHSPSVGPSLPSPHPRCIPGESILKKPPPAQQGLFSLSRIKWRRLESFFSGGTRRISPYTVPLPHMKRITLAALVPLVVERLEIDNQHFRDATISLSVCESPLRPGTFRILVYLFDGRMRNKRRPRMSGTAAVFCYTCHGTRNAHEWHLESAHHAQSSMKFHSLSYAGQAVDDRFYELYDGAEERMPDYLGPAHGPLGQLVRTPPGCVWQDLSPYSGVVTSVMAHEVVVAYYS
ncbi:hypothetical protein B0H13DRAFT_2651782 [Mycena leptocephala]|nr:hypothetical protein B0H13DRAFT_2651782 [Mycena leptocephala]